MFTSTVSVLGSAGREPLQPEPELSLGTADEELSVWVAAASMALLLIVLSFWLLQEKA